MIPNPSDSLASWEGGENQWLLPTPPRTHTGGWLTYLGTEMGVIDYRKKFHTMHLRSPAHSACWHIAGEYRCRLRGGGRRKKKVLGTDPGYHHHHRHSSSCSCSSSSPSCESFWVYALFCWWWWLLEIQASKRVRVSAACWWWRNTKSSRGFSDLLLLLLRVGCCCSEFFRVLCKGLGFKILLLLRVGCHYCSEFVFEMLKEYESAANKGAGHACSKECNSWGGVGYGCWQGFSLQMGKP